MAKLDTGLRGADRRWTWLAWLGVAVALAAGLAWYVTHPDPLPRSDAPVEARTGLDTPVYIGIATGRSLDVRSWSVDAGHGEVELLVCRGGSIGVTSAPEPFCTDLVPAEAAHLDAPDSLVLSVSSPRYSLVEGGPLHLAWRDGIQFGEQDTGPAFEVMVTD